MSDVGRHPRAADSGSEHADGSGRGTLPSLYVLLIGVVAVLNIIGVVMILSASSVASINSHGSAWYFFERQLLWTALGVVAFFAASRIEYRRWRNLVRPILIGTVCLLLVVLIPGIGIQVLGARRWLGVGGWRFQPTEVAKIALLLFVADLLARRPREINSWPRVLRPVLIATAAATALVVAEPDLTSAIVLVLMVAAVLVIGGLQLRRMVQLGIVGAVGLLGLALLEPYRSIRLFSFVHPSSDPTNAGYQLRQSLIALGSGGLTGVGLGAGRAKWLFLPNAHTDFIFAIIGEELGLIGCLLVIAVFFGFTAVGVSIATRAPDRFGALLAGGITFWITAQASLNLGAVTGLLPVTGVPLPFVSFGGSALVFTMLATGMLANVARQPRICQVPNG